MANRTPVKNSLVHRRLNSKWNKRQWIRFLKGYKKFKQRDEDLKVFDDELLRYLNCDLEELLLKVQFVSENESKIRRNVW